MANVNIKFNNKEFLLSCENGQEEHLEQLSYELDSKFKKLKDTLGNIGESKLLLITSITILDEYFETKKNTETKKNELENLKTKFKELKSLVMNYKNEKDKEIDNLKKSQDKINYEFNENNKKYFKILDSATDQIENFIKKIDKEKSVQ